MDKLNVNMLPSNESKAKAPTIIFLEIAKNSNMIQNETLALFLIDGQHIILFCFSF